MILGSINPISYLETGNKVEEMPFWCFYREKVGLN